MNRSTSSQRQRVLRAAVVCLSMLAVALFGSAARAQDDDQYDNQYDDYDTAPDVGYAVNTDVEDSLKTRAKSERLHFCNDKDYVLYAYERPLCPLAAEASDVCPEFVTACARPPSEDRGELVAGGGLGSEGKKKRGGSKTNEPEPEQQPKELKLSLPPWLAGLFKVLFWVVVAVLVAVVIYLIASAIGRAQKDKVDADDLPPEEALAPKREKPGIVESDVQRLLARAKQHREQGRFGNAVDDLYAALLRYLEGEQLIVLERHRTNGDYVRSLRQHPDWQALVRECGRDVERSQFGKRAPDASTFDGLLRRIEPVVVRAATLLLVMVSALWHVSCGGDGQEGPKVKRHWGSLGDDSAVGLSLFVGLLEDRNYEVKQRIRKVSDLDESVGMLVVYDDTSLEDEDWKALEEWVRSGKELWIGGDDAAARHFGGTPTGKQCEAPPKLTENFVGQRLFANSDGSLREALVTSVASTLLPSSALLPLLECDGPLWSRRVMGNGAVTLFADASSFANGTLVSADNAIVLMSMVQAAPMVVEFAGGLTGAGAESPYQALFNAKLGPLLLQIALFMGVWYLSRGIPFATLRDPKDAGRRRFLDHLSALGRIFQKANARQHALHHYAAWALSRLNDRVRPGQRMSIIELGAALAKRTGQPQAQVLETLADAATARNQPDGPLTGEELKVLKRLEAFVIETGGTK